MTNPGKQDWNQFWGRNIDSRFTQKSWSKIRIINLLNPKINPQMSVLDAGSGSGFFSSYFISKGCSVYSLDYSDNALEMTKKITSNRSKEYIKEDLVNPDFGNKYSNRFDLIFTDGLFEHFNQTDQQKIMANFKKAKRDSGLIATFVPNRFSWWQLIRPVFMPNIYEKPFSLEMLELLHRGMQIDSKGGINVLPFRFSPDRLLGPCFGMILYCFAR